METPRITQISRNNNQSSREVFWARTTPDFSHVFDFFLCVCCENSRPCGTDKRGDGCCTSHPTPDPDKLAGGESSTVLCILLKHCFSPPFFFSYRHRFVFESFKHYSDDCLWPPPPPPPPSPHTHKVNVLKKTLLPKNVVLLNVTSYDLLQVLCIMES